MATKNEENWMMHYNELKAYVAEHHHFPDKHKVEFRRTKCYVIGAKDIIRNVHA